MNLPPPDKLPSKPTGPQVEAVLIHVLESVYQDGIDKLLTVARQGDSLVGTFQDGEKTLSFKLTSDAVEIALVTAPELAGPEEGTDLADNYTQELNPAAAEIMDRLVEPVRKLILTAGSLQEIQDKLYSLYPKMPSSDFGELLETALLAANLTGRADVSEGG
jgi:phage gp29-like protein